MKIIVDTAATTMRCEDGEGSSEIQLYSPEAFDILTDLWVKAGWELRYPYLFSWLGRPVIQLPEDLIAIQEVIYRCSPSVVIETGVAHGGSLVFYASVFEAMGGGRVVGVDIEIRPHNRTAIEQHRLAHRIALVQGSSVDPDVVDQVRQQLTPEDTVLVILDSNHTKRHVLGELEAYAPLVTVGSYLVATDGVMELVHDVPRGSAAWLDDNPKAAAAEFLSSHPEFELEDPLTPVFNEAGSVRRATHWPGAFLRRVR
jgi:cephalosporin hydroxylase